MGKKSNRCSVHIDYSVSSPIVMVECTIRDMVGNMVAIAKKYHNPNEKVIEMTL